MTTPATAPERDGQRIRRRATLATLCAGMFMAMLDNVVVSNALPRIDDELGAGMTGLQWIVEAYSLVFAALLLPGGSLGDRYGRRRFYLVGLGLFTAGSLLCALAPGLGVLVAARAVQGVGAAALIPQSLAILRVTYPDPVARARAFAIWSGVSALGLALGPAIGGPLVDAFGWPSVFLVNVPIGVAALVVGALAVPETSGRDVTVPLAGQAAAVVSLATLVYALIEGPVRGWSSTPVLGCLGVAATGLIVFSVLQSRPATAALDRALLQDRVVAGAAFAAFVFTFGMFGVITYLGLYMQIVLGWSPTGAGVATLPATLTIVLVAPLAARLSLHRGPRAPLVVGLLSCGAGLLALSFFGTDASYAHFWWTLPLLGLGMGLGYTPVTMVIMTRVPVDRAGNASAVTNISREVGGVAGIAVMGTLLTSRLSSTLDDRLVSLDVPRNVIDRVLAAATGGGEGGLALDGPLPPAVREAGHLSFVDGLHLALWVAAACMIGCALLVARLTRPE